MALKLIINAPARVKLALKQVDQDLFNNLAQLLGQNFFDTFQGENYLKAAQPVEPERLTLYP